MAAWDGLHRLRRGLREVLQARRDAPSHDPEPIAPAVLAAA
jgi:hypothetical protein